jgi:uncharacterized protein (DUF2236 family)
MTARLLPSRLRQAFGLPFGLVEQAMAEASLASLRATWWALPGAIRFLPAYRAAMRRLAGRPGRDPVGEVLDLMVGLARGSR